MSFFRPPPDDPTDENDVHRWVRVMFGAGSALGAGGVPLVVHVGGVPLAAPGKRVRSPSLATMEAIRELTQSLKLHSQLEVPGDALSPRPTVATVRLALDVLQDPEARRATLTAAIGAIALGVLSPLEPLLQKPTASTRDRLSAWRARVDRSTRALHMTATTQRQIHDALMSALSDDVLTELARAEDEALRPRIVQLAQKIVDALAMTYLAAIERFGSNADAIAQRIVHQMPEQLALRDVPDQLKIGFTTAMATYLESETSAEVAGTLATLAAEYRDVLYRPTFLAFPSDAYRDLAIACWRVVSSYC